MSIEDKMPKTERGWSRLMYPKKRPNLKKNIERKRKEFERTPPASQDPENALKRYRRGDGSLNSDELVKGGDGASTPASKLPPSPTKPYSQPWPEAKWHEMDMATHHGADWTKIKDRMGNVHRAQFPNKGPNKGKEIPYKPHETN